MQAIKCAGMTERQSESARINMDLIQLQSPTMFPLCVDRMAKSVGINASMKGSRSFHICLILLCT